MPATIEQVTEQALTLSVTERATLAQTLLNSVESATTTPEVTEQMLAKRRAITQKFVTGEWSAEFAGFEEARAADRAAAAEQARISDEGWHN